MALLPPKLGCMTDTTDDIPESEIGSASLEFGLDLYKRIASDNEDSNMFMSPFSISTVLTLTSLGARGDTAAQMRHSLRLDELGDTAHHKYQEYMEHFHKTEKNFTLTSANRMFVSSRTSVLHDYAEKTHNYYGVQAVSADFAHNANSETDRINNWVAAQTGVIKYITSLLSPHTSVLLVSAIYFKGAWCKQFDASKTKKGFFTLMTGEKIAVDMMHADTKFKYATLQDLQCSIIELPYTKTKKLSMVIFLPYKVDGLLDLERELTRYSLQRALERLYPVPMDLSLPKFTMESSFSLENVLPSLGMTDVFLPGKANLSGVDGTRLLNLSRVAHKAYIEVSEAGVKGVASSKNSFWPYSSVSQHVKADHPFMFIIKDNRENVVLFMGRVTRPSSL